MRTLLLGIDVGTSTCKAALVDAERGTELAHGRAPTPWVPVGSGAEADPHELFAAALTAARAALGAGPEGRLVAIGVASMAEAGVLLDRRGEVLHPAIAWHDGRGAQQALALGKDFGADTFARRTGLPVSSLCSLVKLRWLLDKHRLAAVPRRWCNVAEWIVRCLGGDELSELSLASRTGMLDLRARAPYGDALAWAGVRGDLLGELVTAGTPAGTLKKGLLGASEGVTLTVAGMDHLCAGVGVGVLAPGDVLDSCGTAEALVRVLEPPLGPEQISSSVHGGLTVGWHLAPGRQALLGALWSGVALQEVRDALGLVSAVERRPAAGRSNPPLKLDLDLHSPERRPLRLPSGVPPGRAWQAAVTAVADEVERIIGVMDSLAGPRRRVVVTGGWTHDPTVMKAKRRLAASRVSGVGEAGARGAALLAGVAAGLYTGLDQLPASPPVEPI